MSYSKDVITHMDVKILVPMTINSTIPQIYGQPGHGMNGYSDWIGFNTAVHPISGNILGEAVRSVTDIRDPFYFNA